MLWDDADQILDDVDQSWPDVDMLEATPTDIPSQQLSKATPGAGGRTASRRRVLSWERRSPPKVGVALVLESLSALVPETRVEARRCNACMCAQMRAHSCMHMHACECAVANQCGSREAAVMRLHTCACAHGRAASRPPCAHGQSPGTHWVSRSSTTRRRRTSCPSQPSGFKMHRESRVLEEQTGSMRGASGFALSWVP